LKIIIDEILLVYKSLDTIQLSIINSIIENPTLNAKYQYSIISILIDIEK